MSKFRKLDSIEKVALIGSGLIGAGWAVQFLLAGYRVVAWDPAVKFSAQLRKDVRRAFSHLQVVEDEQDRLLKGLTFAESCEAAVARADFVQENGPEDLGNKRSLLKEIASLAPTDVVIASSTSGLLMSDLQQGCRAPARLVVGHPFNPVYLMPLVEVVGGDQTSPHAVTWLCSFYRCLGKKPVHCETETVGFIANRFQEAVFREALHMIDAGEATVEQIDDAVRFGPGLRWAFMGPFLTYHLAGGTGGIRSFFENFGDTLQMPYSRLAAPLLSEELIANVIGSCEETYGQYDLTELDEWRDGNIRTLTSQLQPLTDRTVS